MTEKPPIPPSPTEDEYLKAVAGADLPPLTAEDPIALFADWLAEGGAAKAAKAAAAKAKVA